MVFANVECRMLFVACGLLVVVCCRLLLVVCGQACDASRPMYVANCVCCCCFVVCYAWFGWLVRVAYWLVLDVCRCFLFGVCCLLFVACSMLFGVCCVLLRVVVSFALC